MIKRILLFFVFFISCKQLFCQEDCVLKKSQDSIFVYTCKVGDSRLKSIKAHFTINTKLSVLAAYILDVPDYTQWQYNTIETEVLKKISDNEIIYRTEVEAPWPVSNRDLVMHLKITQDTLTRVMTIDVNSMPGYVPEKDNIVRIPLAKGKWIVEPLNRNELFVQYTFLVDPGGSVPVWLVNLALADGPYESFRNLKARIKNGGMVKPVSFIVD